MGKRNVTIAAGQKNVLLPDGGLYDAGDVVTLTEEQYDALADGVIGDEVTDGPAQETSGDAVVQQAENVALTAVAAAGANPTKAEFDALLDDVTNILAALKGDGKPMVPDA